MLVHSLFYSLTLFRPVFDRPPCVLRPDRLKSALWCCKGGVQWHKNENIDVSPRVEGEILYNFPVLVLFVDLYGTWVTGSLLSYRAAGLYAACAALSCVCSALGWIVCCVLRSIFFPPTTKTSVECTTAGPSWDITVFTTQTKCIHHEIHKKKGNSFIYFIFFPSSHF